MTVKELIEKLNKLNPDGNVEVKTRNPDEEEEGYNSDILYVSLEENEEDEDGNLIIVLHVR